MPKAKKASGTTTKTKTRKRVADYFSDSDNYEPSVEEEDNNTQPEIEKTTKRHRKNKEPSVEGDKNEEENVDEAETLVLETPEAELGNDGKIGDGNNEDDDIDLKMGAQIVDVPIPENLVPAAATNSLKNPEENEIEEINCPKDHTLLHEFQREGNAKYCEPRQKFSDAICMSCGKGFCNNSKDPDKVMPNEDQPLYFCSNYESICSAVLCNNCYTTMLAKSGKVSRRRR
jgi:Fe2+ or Zn2+ uptake regulation protein